MLRSSVNPKLCQIVPESSAQKGGMPALKGWQKCDDITDECVTLQQNKTSVSDSGLPKNLRVVLQE